MVLRYRGPRKLTQREGQVCGTAAQQVARDSQVLPRPGGVGEGGEEAEMAGKFTVQTGISRGQGRSREENVESGKRRGGWSASHASQPCLPWLLSKMQTPNMASVTTIIF